MKAVKLVTVKVMFVDDWRGWIGDAIAKAGIRRV